jgi:hypothetical protein
LSDEIRRTTDKEIRNILNSWSWKKY